MLQAESLTPAAFTVTASSPARNPARISLLRSPPFRVGITFWVLFVVILSIAGALFHRSLQERLLAGIDDSLNRQYAAIATTYSSLGPEAAIALIDGSRTGDTRVRYFLADADGDRVTGSLPFGLTESGRNTVTGSALGLGDLERHRVLTRPFGSGLLSLELGLQPLDELRALALECLLRALAVATGLGILAALLLAWRMRQRMLGWSRALERVADGDLGARLPLGTVNDDVDVMAERINEMLERLRRTVESMRQVSNDIAHDLKTPLNRLTIDLEDAVELHRTGSCANAPLERALDEASEINGTFEALLSIARIEAGARKARFHTFELAALLDDLAEIYGPVVEEAGLSLRTEVATAKPMPLLGDRALITQLIVNLIENAMRHGSPQATTVTLSAGRQNGVTRLSVADDGPGVPEEEREKVFRRLYRLERSRTTRGTGLGLSLVKAIAELHCGTIQVEDNAPGLRVTIIFDDNCPLE